MASDAHPQQPVVNRQVGNGVSVALAPWIIAGAASYSINVWLTTRKPHLRSKSRWVLSN